jgi:exopolysaccharide production protein ExoQ
LCIGLFVGSSTFLVLSNSISPFVGLLIGGGCAAYLGACRRGLPPQDAATLLVGMSALCILTVLAYLNQDALTELVGRDPTLTGRTSIWHFSGLLVNEAPLLGHGHGAWSSPRIREFTMLNVGWLTPHAHNTPLDLQLQLGLPGLMLGLLIVSVVAIRALVLVWAQGSAHVIWLALVIGFGLRAHSETLVVDPAVGEMLWLALAYAVSAKSIQRHRASCASNSRIGVTRRA